MITIETLNEMADDTPESKYTVPGDILFFYPASTAQESLKKLKNHNFKIGYVYNIQLNGETFTRIIAYNQKHDIVKLWMSYQNNEMQLPANYPNLLSCLIALRVINIDGVEKIKCFREEFNNKKRQTTYAKNQFRNLPYIESIDKVDLSDFYWPVLENPIIEEKKQNQMLESQSDNIFISDMAVLCNIYKFDLTYELLDEGLKKIYKPLADNKDAKFCQQIINMNDIRIVEAALENLNLSWQDLVEIFERQELLIPTFQRKKTKNHPIKQKRHILFRDL